PCGTWEGGVRGGSTSASQASSLSLWSARRGSANRWRWFRWKARAESRLWREQVERYHYLGCRVPFGAHLRYWVRNRDRELACLLWTSPAWKMQARDAWIGWSEERRKSNLQWIVNNGRFLILPWVRAKGLASKILALSARQMP